MLAEKQNGKLTDNLLKQISKVTTRYVVGVLTDVAILATSHSIFLTIIGLKYSIAIGIMTAMLSFIPYFGTLVSGIIPFTFSLLISTNPYMPLLIILYFWIITFVDHNILIPTIIGGNVHLNPLITILSIIAAGTIWGIPGMIIVIPAIGIIKIICDNVEGLEPYGYVLGIETNQKALNKLKDIWAKIKEKEEDDDSPQTQTYFWESFIRICAGFYGV
jgi:predicted PurR-regulated permease PerM